MGTPTTFLPPLEKDQFAPALFKKMSGAEKLSSPSCQPFDAGFTLNPDTVAVGDMPTHQVTYDTEIVDNNQQVSPGDSFALTLRHLLAMLARSATARGGIRSVGVEQFVIPGSPVLLRLVDENFVVAHACSLTRATTITPVPVTQAHAHVSLEQHLATQPTDRGVYQVVPAYLAAA